MPGSKMTYAWSALHFGDSCMVADDVGSTWLFRLKGFAVPAKSCKSTCLTSVSTFCVPAEEASVTLPCQANTKQQCALMCAVLAALMQLDSPMRLAALLAPGPL